jgi:ABC-2 type transport system permease protein
MQKEFIQAFRDRRTLIGLLALPLIELFLYGYAIHMNVEHIPIVVADQSLDAASHAYVDAMTNSGYFDVVGYEMDAEGVMDAIDAGRARGGIVIPPDFAAQTERRAGQVLFLIDGSDLFTSQSAYSAANSIAQAHATEVLAQRMARQGGALHAEEMMPLDTRTRILYNPNLTDLWFVVPGMAAMLLQTQSIAMTAAAVVREREVGTIEQLLVTPIRPGELMIGKIAPNLVISMINMLSIIGFGVYWFKVPFQGNFWLFFWLAFMYVFSGLGLGLLVSSLSQNQRQSQQLTVVVSFLGLILGGFIFPQYTMPPVLRAVGHLFPLAYFIPISRGIITKGVGLRFLWEHVVALCVYIVVVLVFASQVFNQELE